MHQADQMLRGQPDFNKKLEHSRDSCVESACCTLYADDCILKSSVSAVYYLHKNSRRCLDQICISEWACEATGVDGSKWQLSSIFVKLSCIQPQSKHIIVEQPLPYHVKKSIRHPWRASLSQRKALHQTTSAALSVVESPQ